MLCPACALTGGSDHNHSRVWGGWLIGLTLLLFLARPSAFARPALAGSNNDNSGRTAAAGKGANPSGTLPPATRVLAVQAETTGKGVKVIIKADGVMMFTPQTLENPWRIVVDIKGVRSAIGTPSTPVASALVKRLRVGQPEAGVVRVVLDLYERAAYKLDLEGDTLLVTVGDYDAAHRVNNPLPPATQKPAPAPLPANANAAVAMVSTQPQAKRSANEPTQRADRPAEDAATMSRLMRRVEELEARVHELEGKQAVAETQPATQPATPPVKETVASTATPAARQESNDPHDFHNHDVPSGRPALQLQGYADVDYRATNERGRNNAFLLGQLDLFITSRLSDKFNVLSELVIQAGQDNAFSFEIHRLLLQYYPNDYFNLNVGRYHTAIGYYNTAYHHGQWFQTAATRPFIYAFEGQGGMLPLHNVGVSLSGRIPSGTLGLRYFAEIGNGRSVNSPGDRAVQTANDENEGKAVNFGLLVRPDSPRGLQAGFSVYRDRLTPNGRPDVNQTIMAAHAVFHNSDYEWLNEALLLRHAPSGGPHVFNSAAYYTQMARRFGQIWPFFRYEYTNVPDGDPIYPTVGRRNGPTAGLRYDLTEFAAFKVQYDYMQRRRQKSLNELLLQLAFTF